LASFSPLGRRFVSLTNELTSLLPNEMLRTTLMTVRPPSHLCVRPLLLTAFPVHRLHPVLRSNFLLNLLGRNTMNQNLGAMTFRVDAFEPAIMLARARKVIQAGRVGP
jgi:hypothetical protein